MMIQCSAGNLTALLDTIRWQIGIVDTMLSVYDESFEDCLVVSMDDLDWKSQDKVHKFLGDCCSL
jgi:hypothetical protein